MRKEKERISDLENSLKQIKLLCESNHYGNSQVAFRKIQEIVDEIL